MTVWVVLQGSHYEDCAVLVSARLAQPDAETLARATMAAASAHASGQGWEERPADWRPGALKYWSNDLLDRWVAIYQAEAK